jgi:hypothetical protein
MAYHKWQKAEALATSRQNQGLNSVKDWEREAQLAKEYESIVRAFQADLDKCVQSK